MYCSSLIVSSGQQVIDGPNYLARDLFILVFDPIV